MTTIQELRRSLEIWEVNKVMSFSEAETVFNSLPALLKVAERATIVSEEYIDKHDDDLLLELSAALAELEQKK